MMKLWLEFLIVALAIWFTQQRTLRQNLDTKADENINPNNYAQTFENCKCDRRYIKHYEIRGCKPSILDVCGCPVKFDCPNLNEIEDISERECYYNGQIYYPGDPIDTSDPCQKCLCSIGLPTEIQCTETICSRTNDVIEPNCHQIYDIGQCCHRDIICHQNENENDEFIDENITCNHKGVIYPLGAKIISDDDPCEVCFCTEEWIRTNGSTTSCYQTHCSLERFKIQLAKGCIPIYQDFTCCPSDFYCAPSDDFVIDNRTLEIKESEDITCLFLGKQFNVGDSVSISEDNDCLLCTCEVPQDMTCVRKTCEPNPNKENCFPYHTADGGCCPQYECRLNDAERATTDNSTTSSSTIESEIEVIEDENPTRFDCSETVCEDNLVCMLYLTSCVHEGCSPVPTCVSTNSSCPTPMCDMGCYVTEQDENHCPTCVCDGDIERNLSELKCEESECSNRDCQLIEGPEGCPVCKCKKDCPALNCDPQCNVLIGVEGGCPKCVCENEEDGCPTPICAHEGCLIETGEHGCPTCICNKPDISREYEDAPVVTTSKTQRWNQQQHQQRSFDYVQQSNIPLTSQTDDEYDDEIVAMPNRPSISQEGISVRHRNQNDAIKSKSSDRTRQPGVDSRFDP